MLTLGERSVFAGQSVREANGQTQAHHRNATNVALLKLVGIVLAVDQIAFAGVALIPDQTQKHMCVCSSAAHVPCVHCDAILDNWRNRNVH